MMLEKKEIETRCMNVFSRIQYIASMEKWNIRQRVFVVEQFFKNNSYVQTIRELCAQF